MQSHRAFLELLTQKRRVEITPLNCLQRLKVFGLVMVLFTVSLSSLLLFQYGLTFFTLSSALVLLLVTLGVIYYFRIRIKSLAIKGDMMIINSFDNKACVTSIRSIKTVRTNTIFGFQWTNIDFKLDGVTRSCLFVNRISSVPVSPEIAIKKALQISKKRKANHKPGSVSV